jgi:spermidine synthase
MLPWTLLDSARIPGDDAEIRLHQRGGEYSIRVDNYELMNSRVHGSEDALASLALERLATRDDIRVLIGGLGMGFTLAAVLKDVGTKSRVEVAELIPAVVRWHRGPLAAVSGHALDDKRTVIREGDVARIIRSEKNAYDAILLDVDNGPRALTAKGNDRLYSMSGLRAAFDALRPGGILAIWSAGPDVAFVRRLQQAGFATEEVRARGHGKRGSTFLIWMGKRV